MQLASMHLSDAQTELAQLAEPADAKNLARFFKTGPGDYGEGDQFRGIRVPVVRKLVRRYRDLPLADVTALLASPWHEDRLLALLILIEQYRRGDAAARQTIFDLYLAHTDRINNWDLVDLSAEHIVGAHLFGGDPSLLTRLARSASLWERRIAMLATFHFIRQGSFDEPLRLADLLLHDTHDLIHKAVGWMLREVGNRDMAAEEAFLRSRYRTMPRTMLRYAIEKFPPARRQAYLAGEI